LLVLQLTVVQNLSDRSFLSIGDHYQIEPFVFRQLESIAGVNEASVLVFMVNKQHLRCTDLPVNQLSFSDKSFLLQLDKQAMLTLYVN
jgi:hypothetical protein